MPLNYGLWRKLLGIPWTCNVRAMANLRHQILGGANTASSLQINLKIQIFTQMGGGTICVNIAEGHYIPLSPHCSKNHWKTFQ